MTKPGWLLPKQPTTFHAMTEDLAPRGRFAGVNKTSLTGQEPIQQIPRQPEGSWTNDPVPNVGDPLGYSIDAVEPVGTEAEIRASIVDQANPPMPDDPPAATRDALPSAAPAGGLSNSNSKLRRL
jgi:hypothetical protein